MQALCMPLLNKIPSNLISDVQPNSNMVFMTSWAGGSHRPNYGLAYGVIEGLDLPIAMFFSSDENPSSYTGFDTCDRGHGDGDWVSIGCNLINTIELYYKNPLPTDSDISKFIINTAQSDRYGNITPTYIYTPNYFESQKDYLIPDFQTFYLMQEDFKKMGITFCTPEIRKQTIVNCGNYILLHSQGNWIASSSLPNDVIGKTIYQIHTFNRSVSSLSLTFKDYKKAVSNTKERLSRGGQVFYSIL